MKVISFLTIACTTLITLSCSTISREDCKRDMLQFGYSHGQKGQAPLSDEIRNVCLRGDATVDLEGYQNSFERGWSEYCTPIHGFLMGKSGDIYKSYCPPEKENLFHEKFLVGKNVYDKKDQAIELEEKIKDISPSAEHDPSLKDKLNKLENELRELNRDIQSLEQIGMNPVHSN